MPAAHSEENIGAALSVAAARLRAAGIPGSRLDAELLLGFLLGASRTRLAIDATAPLDPETRAALDELIQQRIAGTSVAYLTGSKEFMGHDFAVGPGVLVPRPETELLVEHAISTLAAHWTGESVRVLDLCTGSGAIALSLALLTDHNRVRVTGSDISPAALQYAGRNRQALGLDDRVRLVEGDLLTWTRGPWDMILTNPPYLRSEQIDGNFEIGSEPRLALDGGHDGLELIVRILDQAVEVAAPRFAMTVEIDPEQADAVHGLAEARFPSADVIIIPDLAGRARFVSLVRKERQT